MAEPLRAYDVPLALLDDAEREVHECERCSYLLCPRCGGHATVVGQRGARSRGHDATWTCHLYGCRVCADRFVVCLPWLDLRGLYARRHGRGEVNGG